jgi:hypothetical protein
VSGKYRREESIGIIPGDRSSDTLPTPTNGPSGTHVTLPPTTFSDFAPQFIWYPARERTRVSPTAHHLTCVRSRVVQCSTEKEQRGGELCSPDRASAAPMRKMRAPARTEKGIIWGEHATPMRRHPTTIRGFGQRKRRGDGGTARQLPAAD